MTIIDLLKNKSFRHFCETHGKCYKCEASFDYFSMRYDVDSNDVTNIMYSNATKCTKCKIQSYNFQSWLPKEHKEELQKRILSTLNGNWTATYNKEKMLDAKEFEEKMRAKVDDNLRKVFA